MMTMYLNFKNNVFIFFQNYFCGVLWEQKFQTHKKNVENCKKLLKKLEGAAVKKM